MKNYMIYAAKATIVAFVVVVVFLMGRCYGFREAMPLLNAYDNYNAKCEILLDSIAIWDKSFNDTTGETDVYYNYIDSKEKLDSIIYSK